jgi:hypothetical protein
VKTHAPLDDMSSNAPWATSIYVIPLHMKCIFLRGNMKCIMTALASRTLEHALGAAAACAKWHQMLHLNRAGALRLTVMVQLLR